MTHPLLQLSNAQSDISVIILDFNQEESKAWISTGKNQSGLRLSSFIMKGSPLNLLFLWQSAFETGIGGFAPSLIEPIWSPNMVGNQPRGINQALAHLNKTMTGGNHPPTPS
jgi:hypothetical protein